MRNPFYVLAHPVSIARRFTPSGNGVFAGCPQAPDPTYPQSIPRVWTSQVQMYQTGIAPGPNPMIPHRIPRAMPASGAIAVPRGPGTSIPIADRYERGGIFGGFGSGPDGLG